MSGPQTVAGEFLAIETMVRRRCLLEASREVADRSAVEPDPVKRDHYEREVLRLFRAACRLKGVRP